MQAVKDGSISFENVDFVYDEKEGKKVLSTINLSIKSGQTVGIIGRTGSSKSGLVQLIARLYDVSGGRILLGGTDVWNRRCGLQFGAKCAKIRIV